MIRKRKEGLKLIAMLWNAGPSYGIRGCVPRARLDPCGGTRLDDNLPDLVRCRRSVTASLKRKGPGYTVQGAIVGLYVILEKCLNRGAVVSSLNRRHCAEPQVIIDRKSTRLNSSHRTISYAVFCL